MRIASSLGINASPEESLAFVKEHWDGDLSSWSGARPEDEGPVLTEDQMLANYRKNADALHASMADLV